MPISNSVIITGEGWEVRVPVISAATGFQLVSHLSSLMADKVTTPQIISDGDMNPCAAIIPSDIKCVRVESGVQPKVSMEQIVEAQYALLRVQKAFYDKQL